LRVNVRRGARRATHFWRGGKQRQAAVARLLRSFVFRRQKKRLCCPADEYVEKLSKILSPL
jgi:hypothetical protein